MFKAIHDGNPDAELLAYQYLQMLPQIAKGDANKVWIVPSEITDALKGLANGIGGLGPGRRIVPPVDQLSPGASPARTDSALGPALSGEPLRR